MTSARARVRLGGMWRAGFRTETDCRVWFVRREALYKHGGLLSVTSRILVVDLLSKKLPAEAIAGLVVLHAEE